jgi:hypothetical protein
LVLLEWSYQVTEPKQTKQQNLQLDALIARQALQEAEAQNETTVKKFKTCVIL